ncbi:MAG: DEAD/DEAH box helicase, partial [Micrococcaceae bacterium]|nr:DEAD/DEAH box helicase [Micrococcaceae bacterium]
MREPNALIEQLGHGDSPEALTHLHVIPAREAVHGPWPQWAHPEVVEAFERCGVQTPWLHQVQAAHSAHEGHHTIVATGTASGKSLSYQLPALDAIHRAELDQTVSLRTTGSVVLYLSPTKALAADQRSALIGLGLPTVKVASYDGDTDPGERRWIRDHANLVLTNPDMLHFGILPNHPGWARFFRRLSYVVIDEAH